MKISKKFCSKIQNYYYSNNNKTPQSHTCFTLFNVAQMLPFILNLKYLQKMMCSMPEIKELGGIRS